MENASIRLVSASLIGFSLPAVHLDQRLLLFLHVPDDLSVGALPLFDVVGQYCFKLCSCSSSIVVVNARKRLDSSTSTYLNSKSLSEIISWHFQQQSLCQLLDTGFDIFLWYSAPNLTFPDSAQQIFRAVTNIWGFSNQGPYQHGQKVRYSIVACDNCSTYWSCWRTFVFIVEFLMILSRPIKWRSHIVLWLEIICKSFFCF